MNVYHLRIKLRDSKPAIWRRVAEWREGRD